MQADRKELAHNSPPRTARSHSHPSPDVAPNDGLDTKPLPRRVPDVPTTTLTFREGPPPSTVTFQEALPAVRTHRPENPERPEHILIVDDEYWITDVIYEQLSMQGFSVSTTNHSMDVMELLANNDYDLVILDIYMPPPDGLTLLNQIREAYPFLPVLMLTAFSDADTASRAMREGAYDYIVKPHQTGQLVSRIERALERGQLLRERAHAKELLEQRVAEQTQQLRAQSKQLSHMLERVLVTYRATVKALEAALDVRDQSAPGHCRRVAKLAVQLGTRLGLEGNDLVALEHGALLHDIGKLGVRDSVLMKPGPLAPDEWSHMRKHPEIGCGIVEHIDFLDEALPIIRNHHERYDGSGYPDGLAGTDIPLLARIFSVVDVFDALTNHRPYKKALSTEQVLAYVEQEKGKQFDPHVVDAFTAMMKERVQA